jgi:hypothetical protein
MEILKKPRKIFGRFYDLLPSGSGSRSAEKSANLSTRLSLSLENEILGNWLCTHKQPLANVLRRIN